MTKKQLTKHEINETIAEFEFGEQEIHIDNKSIATNFEYDDTVGDKYPATIKKLYTESLDSLVPVWKKMGATSVKIGDSYSFNQSSILLGVKSPVWSDGYNVFLATARATALAIQELGGGE